MSVRVLLLIMLVLAATAESKPFFDALYDAISGKGHRSYGYGYNGYGSYGGYGSYDGYGGPAQQPARARSGKTYAEICRVHNPPGIPGSIQCPY